MSTQHVRTSFRADLRSALLVVLCLPGLVCLGTTQTLTPLYTAPFGDAFIQNSGEVNTNLNIGQDTIADIQSQINTASANNTSGTVVVTLTGNYTVTSAPLTLPSNTALTLNGSISAAPGATAASLLSVNGANHVGIVGGTYNGNGANLYGIQLLNGAKVNIDAVTVENTGLDGIYLSGSGNANWDQESTVTRSTVIYAGGNGITLTAITQSIILDSTIKYNAGAGVELDAAHSNVVNNIIENNGTGVNVTGTYNLVSDDTISNNRGVGLTLASASTNNKTIENTIANNGSEGIDLDGSANLVYYTEFNNTTNLVDHTAGGNWVLPKDAPLNAPNSNYFYPPTINNQQTGTIVNGMPRFDLTVNGGNISDVQTAYNSAVSNNPGSFIVLHMNGSFTFDAGTLSLNSFTSVILNGTITVSSSSTGNPVFGGPNPIQYISISGGTIDCAGNNRGATSFSGATMAEIDQLTIENCGVKTTVTNTGEIHFFEGGGYDIIHGNTINGASGRAIWTQEPQASFIALGNNSQNAGGDGIDFDSQTSNSVQMRNIDSNNARYGLFVEQGASYNVTYGNTAENNHIGYNIVANGGTNNCNRNSAFVNSLIGNGYGLRVGAGSGPSSNQNFMFDNVVENSSTFAIHTNGPGTDNYFSENALSGNVADYGLSSTTDPNFFNEPDISAAGFSVAAGPDGQTVQAGSSVSYGVVLTSINGYSGTDTLSGTGLPSGATAAFSPSSVANGSGSATLTISTSTATPAGTYSLTIGASDGTTSGSTTVSLAVTAPSSNFSVSASPSSLTVSAGNSGTSSISVAPVNGFTDTVNLSLSGLPAGVTASFNPASITGGSGSSTLTLATTSSAAAGTYTITVTGTDASGSPAHSTTISLTITVPTTLPPGWGDTDIGTVGLAGSATFSNGVFTIHGSGTDIWSTADTFHYASESQSGDVTITARVASQQNTNAWAKSGVMIRETTAANSSYVFAFVTPSNGVNMQYRNGTGTSAVQLAQQTGQVAPYWIRLVRSGSTFTGFSSADGVTWTQVGQISVSMATNALEGLAVCAHNNTVLNTSTFNNVTVSTPQPPVTLSPTADAYVRDGTSADTNFGTATTLVVKNSTTGFNRNTFLKFDLSTVTSVSSAKLRLFGNLGGTSGTSPVTAHQVADTSWSETGITWNNQPAIGGAMTTVSVGLTAQYWEWDVTSYIQSQKAAGQTSVTLELENDVSTAQPVTFNSREATSNPPQLVVTP